ncbi:GntR family transcriptional regulator [Actinoalloteichus hymeniacidonis]|uniref:Transcriptional regulator n=1 Tax=Actinoalloteichus hymeniacidonis TaxID=340345 RepID=A0AAC9HUB7_9PSEU|nr:GntR family transcriptional regulator [Actinoalloteichus hymeniacidonis]AOS65276.1 transcriptional regulator [Actinoalloteichus hymeniacidonis]MBB5906640.1 GntR family transcriptional regulator [Actinoalloteichus hymeniacidonis]
MDDGQADARTASKQLPSRRIADAVRASIVDGELNPGDKLPSERELAARFGTARNTAREAVRLLADEGLVSARHGKGVFVREQQRLFRWGHERYSKKVYRETGLTPFRLEMHRQGKSARIDCVAIDRITPPADVAEHLKADISDQSVIRRKNLYYADDEPVQVVITYIRWEDAAGTLLLEPKTGPGGIYGRLEDAGYYMASGQDQIVARMPSHDEASFLQLPPSTPVLEVLHTSYDQNGEPFEVSRFVHRGDRTGLHYTFAVDD